LKLLAVSNKLNIRMYRKYFQTSKIIILFVIFLSKSSVYKIFSFAFTRM
jgi:hypothetical protein